MDSIISRSAKEMPDYLATMMADGYKVARNCGQVTLRSPCTECYRYMVYTAITLNGEWQWVLTYYDCPEEGEEYWDPATEESEAAAWAADDLAAADAAAYASAHADDGQPTRERLHSAWARYAPTHHAKRRRPKGAARISQFLNCEEGD